MLDCHMIQLVCPTPTLDCCIAEVAILYIINRIIPAVSSCIDYMGMYNLWLVPWAKEYSKPLSPSPP